METGRRALARAEATNYPTAIVAAHILLSGIFMLSGEVEQMLHAGRSALDVAEQAQERLYACLARYICGWAEGWLGQHQAAITSIAQAKALGENLGGRILLLDWFAAAEAEVTLSAGQVADAARSAQKRPSAWPRLLAASSQKGWRTPYLGAGTGLARLTCRGPGAFCQECDAPGDR